MNTNNIKTGLIKIPGALTSTGGDGNGQVGGVVAYTGDIYDVALGKNQAAINNDFVEALSGINDDISDVQDDISGLAPIATSGSFNDLIDNPFVVFNSQYIKQINLDGLWRVSFGLQNQVNDYNTNAFGTHITLNYPGTAVGQYNHPTDYALLTVGIGSNNSSRKNGFVVDTAGNIYAYGINGYDGTNVIHPGTGQYSLTQFVNNLDSRATSLQNTINASSTAWSNLAPATNVTLAAITGLNATNAQDAFSEINTVIAPLRTGSISSTLVSDTNFNTTQDQINLQVPYNISAVNPSAEYTDLEDALGSNGSNIPQNLRVGGLTVKFVNSDTGEYEQWRLKSSSWSTNISNWTNSIITRAEGIYWGSDKLTSKINELNDDKSLVGNTNASALESKINALISCINGLVGKVVFYTGTPFTLPQELNSQLNLSRYSYSNTAANTALLGSAICGQAICGNN